MIRTGCRRLGSGLLGDEYGRFDEEYDAKEERTAEDHRSARPLMDIRPTNLCTSLEQGLNNPNVIWLWLVNG